MRDITITIPGDTVQQLLDALRRSTTPHAALAAEGPTPTPANDVRRGPAPPNSQGATQDQDWSDKQKRLIYRLCYDRGLTGEEAKRFIRARVGLPQGNGRPPSVREASDLIDHLMGAESSGGRHGAA